MLFAEVKIYYALKPDYRHLFLCKSLNPGKSNHSYIQILIFAAKMAKVFTTEITSEEIVSDNPIHQRLFKAYVVAKDYIRGDVLEVGCGEGRGVSTLLKHAKSFTAVDKIREVIDSLQRKYPAGKFISMNIPPLGGLEDNTYYRK